ncbi:hypothetical protein E8E14_005754 [Neopestalotiopsis sp. 37M]|nr:hypothetical protein E8E14_005754 [Neopestalotiopsis sp. 37M]
MNLSDSSNGKLKCQDVGDSNADIAGLGIILSFTIQGGLSFVLSAWHVILEKLRSDSETLLLAETSSSDNVNQRRELQMMLIANILKTVGDAQLLNGNFLQARLKGKS